MPVARKLAGVGEEDFCGLPVSGGGCDPSACGEAVLWKPLTSLLSSWVLSSGEEDQLFVVLPQ